MGEIAANANATAVITMFSIQTTYDRKMVRSNAKAIACCRDVSNIVKYMFAILKIKNGF